MTTHKSADQVAAERMMLLAPLLVAGLDKARVNQLKNELAAKYNLSYRTMGRYLTAYREGGYEGLKPKSSKPKTKSSVPQNYPLIVQEAITLRRECPSRSVKTIIKILELEGLAAPGTLSRSTLQRHLAHEGFSSKQLRMYTNKGTASRRFNKEHRCMLYQGDYPVRQAGCHLCGQR